jgi:hypothetical protein
MRVVASIAFLLFFLCPIFSASADTLRLKSGRALWGTFVSGDTNAVQFTGQDGQTRTYIKQDIASVSFGATTKTAAAPATVSVPAGTVLIVRMLDGLDSSKTKKGQRFSATLDADLAAQGRTVAKKGTAVYGRVVDASTAGRIAGSSKLAIQLTEIMMGGSAQSIVTNVVDSAGKNELGKTAKKTAGGAGLGAAIGAIAGNAGKGAAIGAVSGGVLSVASKGGQVKIPSETQISFQLVQPVTLRVNQQTQAPIV